MGYPPFRPQALCTGRSSTGGVAVDCLPLASRFLRGCSKLLSNLCRVTASRAGSLAGKFSSSSRADDDRFTTTPYEICQLADERQLCNAQPDSARDAEIMDSLLSKDFAGSCQGLCSDVLLPISVLLILTAENSREVHASSCILCLKVYPPLTCS